jgi:hypothetical protein
VLAALTVLVSYEVVHYATVEDVRALGPDRVCRHFDQHTIRDKPVPPWVERYVFAPAYWIDDINR